MPISLIVGLLLFIVGFVWIQKNGSAYKAETMASSMEYKQQLPLWGGTSKGVLTLGHTKLSRNRKELAVEIRYDESAHKALSSFGNRYKLRLVTTKGTPVNDIHLSYGIFGTDGSGVLTVKSDKGFVDQSFIVMLIDNGQLVTSTDLNQESQLSDSDLDKSITAELSDPNSESDQSTDNNSQDNKRSNLPPLYYVRLNALNAKRNYRNWDNDSELVEDLFVKDNLKELESDMNDSKTKLKKAQHTLDEMNRRLAENKNDTVAQNGKSDIESSMANLKANYKSAKSRYDKLITSTISSDVLEPKQNKFRAYFVNNINDVN